MDGLIHQEDGIGGLDAVLMAAFVSTIASLYGVANISLYGYGLQTALWEGSGVSVTFAFVGSVLAFVAAYATNQFDFDGLDEVEIGALAVLLVLTVSTPFVPPVNDLFTGSYVWGTGAAVVNLLSFGVLAWK
jgi:hypothetical protein